MAVSVGCTEDARVCGMKMNTAATTPGGVESVSQLKIINVQFVDAL